MIATTVAILLVGLFAFAAQAADKISGIPRIVDGDTIVVGGPHDDLAHP
jgi:hypothetical protein